MVGLDKRFNNLLVGLGGGYAYTTVNGNLGNDAKADTGYGTVYVAVNGEMGFLDLSANYAFNDVKTEGSPVFGYTGKYTANTVSFYVGGGRDFELGKSLLFTPEASLLSTYYDREGYTETSSSVDPYAHKVWDAYDQWSYLGSVGATLSTTRKMDSLNMKMEVQPEIRAHLLHEFNAEMDNPLYSAGTVNDISVTLQAREEDLLKVGAGIRFSKWESDTLEFGLDFDGVFGQDYTAYVFSGRLLHRF